MSNPDYNPRPRARLLPTVPLPRQSSTSATIHPSLSTIIEWDVRLPPNPNTLPLPIFPHIALEQRLTAQLATNVPLRSLAIRCSAVDRPIVVFAASGGAVTIMDVLGTVHLSISQTLSQYLNANAHPGAHHSTVGWHQDRQVPPLNSILFAQGLPITAHSSHTSSKGTVVGWRWGGLLPLFDEDEVWTLHLW